MQNIKYRFEYLFETLLLHRLLADACRRCLPTSLCARLDHPLLHSAALPLFTFSCSGTSVVTALEKSQTVTFLQVHKLIIVHLCVSHGM